jgi:hypothetical protein
MRRAALLAASGKSDKEIAKLLDVSPKVVGIWRQSPLWQTVVAKFSEEIEERGVQSVVDELLADAPQNIRFIKGVRDGQIDDPKDRLDLRLRAAKMLLDKQAPNADARAQNLGAARIILDGRMLAQALHAMREVGAIDITPEAIEKATGEDLPKILSKTPEEFAATYTPPEEEEDE